jgi:hypothetical protein
MNFHVPRPVAILIVVGLVLLAASGVTSAVADALRQSYHADCDLFRPMPIDREPNANDTEPKPLTPEERAECREERASVTLVDALHRAAVGPGIAIVAISGVYLLGAAIAALRRG